MQSLQFLPPAKSDGPFRFREPATSHGDLHELYHEFVSLPRQQGYITATTIYLGPPYALNY